MSEEPFTYAAYADILDVAMASGYAFVDFATLAADPERQPVVVIRHDIDCSLGRMAMIARLEADRGVRATFCVQTAAPVYSLEDPESIRAVTEVLDYGHALGLHFNPAGLSDDEALERVPEQVASLERRFGVPVRVVSFHMPSRRAADHLNLPDGLINAYAPKFFDRIRLCLGFKSGLAREGHPAAAARASPFPAAAAHPPRPVA